MHSIKKSTKIRKDLKKSCLNRGFTLVELAVYMGLLMVFLFLLSGLFVSTLQVQKNSIDTARVEQDSHYLFSRLQYDFDMAEQLTVPSGNGSTTSTLQLTKGVNTYTYFLENGRLKVDNGDRVVNLTSPGVIVSNLSFQRLGNTDGVPSLRVQAKLQAEDASTSNPYHKNLNLVFGLR